MQPPNKDVAANKQINEKQHVIYVLWEDQTPEVGMQLSWMVGSVYMHAV